MYSDRRVTLLAAPITTTDGNTIVGSDGSPVKNTSNAITVTIGDKSYSILPEEMEPTGNAPFDNILTTSQLKNASKYGGDKAWGAFLLKEGKIKGFEGYKDNWGEPFKASVLMSIQQRGTNTQANPYLRYAKRAAKIDLITKVKDLQTFETISNLIDSGDIDLNSRKLGWLENERSYFAETPDDVLYKVKTLAFLNGKNASRWGNLSTAPIEEVLNATTKEEIKKLLTGWQTKSGEVSSTGPSASRQGSGRNNSRTTNNSGSVSLERSKLKSEEAKKAETMLNSIPKNSGINVQRLRNSIINNSTPGDTAESAVGRAIMSLFSE